MRKILFIVVCSLVVSAAAVAAPNPASATAHCKNLQRQAPALFGAGKTYADLAACVAAKTSQATQASTNASKLCAAERDGDAAAFAAGHGGKSFADLYGTNGKDKNAFGKCVSAKASAATSAQQAAELNAAKQCKAWRADPAFAAGHGGKSFADYYGTNAGKKNAFGKCVAKQAKAKTS